VCVCQRVGECLSEGHKCLIIYAMYVTLLVILYREEYHDRREVHCLSIFTIKTLLQSFSITEIPLFCVSLSRLYPLYAGPGQE
jgi:hypothetical protein